MEPIGELAQGMKVRSSDGANLGKIIQVDSGFLVVEKGFFSPKDYSIPTSLVADVREGEVWLSASRGELEHGREEGGRSATGMDAGRAEASAGERRGAVEGQGEHRMQLSEEELEATKRVRETGEVTVKKDVVTEHRRIDVPVTKEEIHVERTPATGTSAPEGEPFHEQKITVPLREEEVEVTKRPRVREEVRVAKTAHQEERHLEGDVKHEEARIERTGEGASRDEPGDDERR